MSGCIKPVSSFTFVRTASAPLDTAGAVRQVESMIAVSVAVWALIALHFIWTPHPRRVTVTRDENGVYLVYIQDKHQLKIHPLPANIFEQPGTPALINLLCKGKMIELGTRFNDGREFKTDLPDWAAPLIGAELKRLMSGLR